MAPIKKQNYSAIAVEDGGEAPVVSAPMSSFKKTALAVAAVGLAAVLVVTGSQTAGFRGLSVVNSVDAPASWPQDCTDAEDEQQAKYECPDTRGFWRGDMQSCTDAGLPTGMPAPRGCASAFISCRAAAPQAMRRINVGGTDDRGDIVDVNTQAKPQNFKSRSANTCYTTSPVYGEGPANFVPSDDTALKSCIAWGAPFESEFQGPGTAQEAISVEFDALPNAPKYGFVTVQDEDVSQSSSTWKYFYEIPDQATWVQDCVDIISKCTVMCDGAEDDSKCMTCLETGINYIHLDGPGNTCTSDPQADPMVCDKILQVME